MRRSIDALVAGASSVLDLTPPVASTPPDAALASYWRATGAYLWRGVESQRSLYEAQQPLFDADALPSVKQ
jgi:hypothetical protein